MIACGSNLYSVIRSPRVSEKSNRIAEKHSQVVFNVPTSATKSDIKQAIELLFKVKVRSVCTLNVAGKIKRFRAKQGKQDSYKKAYVSLYPGQEMNFAFEGGE
jgi:large subunit ribosomal protein L23